MIYKSEITGKEYKTEKECLDDEVAFTAQQNKKVSEQQEAHDKVELQNKIVKECVHTYEQVIKDQNKVINDALIEFNTVKEEAQKAKEVAHRKALDETEILGDMLYEYKKKYGEFVWDEDGTVEETNVVMNAIDDFIKELFGL